RGEDQGPDLPTPEAHVGQIRLETPDSDIPERLRIQLSATSEAPFVDHLHQGCERLRVPVVRRRREEEPMLADVGEGPSRTRALTVDRVAAATTDRRRARRGDVVRLVDDENVE